MSTAAPELFQFRYSMFPEMARWALDYKGVAHTRQSVLPGPHAPKIKKLAGQTCMPVLRHQGEVIRNSDKVLDYIEANWPQQPLYPADPAQRQQAVEIRDRFRAWGPHFRRAYFVELLKDKPYAADVFSRGCAEATRTKYRRHFWLVNLLMRVTMKVTDKQSKRSIVVMEEAFDWLANNVNEHGYLVGDQFTVADLTAATVVNVASLASGTPAAPEQPRNPALTEWVKRWAAEPGVAWADGIYRQHRPASAAIEDRDY